MSPTAVHAKYEVLAARDAATPPWLRLLRQYIDEAILHQIAMTERGEDGHTSSDRGGEEACEALWTQVVDEERAARIPRALSLS